MKQSEKHYAEGCCYIKPAHRLVPLTHSISYVPDLPASLMHLAEAPGSPSTILALGIILPLFLTFSTAASQDECKEHTLGSGRETESKRARVSVNKGVAWTHQEIIHPLCIISL